MATAKISIETEAKNDGLEKLQRALADGEQSVDALKHQLKDLKKVTQDGTKATKEQEAAMKSLRQQIRAQQDENKELSRAIGTTTARMKDSVKAMADGDKGARGLASAFKLTEGFTTALSVAIGGLASNILTGAVAALAEMAGQVVTLGAQMQQTVSQLSAMKNVTDDAAEACRLLNDVYRNTNFEESAVQQMGVQLMNMGYSAQNAAGLIQLCADAAAGLGSGQQGAQQLVDAISRIQAVGELTSKQMVSLKMAGLDLDKAFASLGMNGEQAMKAVEEGTLDTQQAIGALTNYLHEFDGSMTESKNNVIDQWGDVTGNLQTFCAEIGASIFEAFNQSEIVQELIDFTQALVDMVRSDAPGAFTDLKAIASEVLDFIGGLLGFVLDTIKLIIVVLHDAYAAFKSFGAQVVDVIRPAVDAVIALYNAVKAVMSSIGKNFGSEVGTSWGVTFGSNLDPEEHAERPRAARENHFRQTSPAGGSKGGRSGGGGGGSAKAQLTEEEKAVEALAKKYADADKQKWSLLKSSLELAKVNTNMMIGEAKSLQEKQNKLDEMKLAHDQVMEGYSKELVLAEKIKDAEKRDKVIDSINAQIRAEKALYDAKVDAAEWETNYKDLQKESKSIYDRYFGKPDDWKAKVEAIKSDLQKTLEEVDAVMAAPDEEEQMSGMARLLKMTPEAFAEDLAQKGLSLQEFVEQYKNAKAEAAAADAKSKTAAGEWHDYLIKYATDVGKSMGNAMTEWITGAKSASEAMKDFVKGLIQNAVQLLAQWISLYLTFMAFGLYDPHQASLAATKAVFGVGEGGKTVKEMRALKSATGGYITGPGTGTSDSIPAMLSNGEYVLRSSAVDRIGVGALNAMNAGMVPHFADGGSVDEESADSPSGGTVIMNVSAVDAASFGDFLARGGLEQVKQALYEDNRRFASTVGVW